MKRKEWTLGTKVALGTGGLAAVLAVIAGHGLYAISGFRDSLDHVANQSARQLELSGSINTAVCNMTAAQRGVVLYTFAAFPDRVSEARKLFADNREAARKGLADLRPLIGSDDEKRVASHLEATLLAWASKYPDIVRLAESGDPARAAQLLVQEVLPLYTAAGQDCRQLVALTNEGLQQDRWSAQQSVTMNWWITLVLVLVGAGAGAFSIYVTRSARLDISKVAGEISHGSEQVAAASEQVATASQSLAQGTSEQAATLEQTSSSTSEITAVTRKNAENTRSVASVMVKTSALVDGANRNLGEMVQSMKEINGSSEKISKIIRVIDEIAFQTNILALNAAVEAARAGEAGMGFAVVADEVRNLAHRSAQAAKDTAALIEDSIARTSQGGRKLDDVADSIRQITSRSTEVKALVDEIEAGSQEQSRGIEQIAAATQQMEQVTQRSAASAQDSAAASDELAAQARSLNDIVGRLQKLAGIEQTSSGAPPIPRPARRATEALRVLGDSIQKAESSIRPPAPAMIGRCSSFPLDDSEGGF